MKPSTLELIIEDTFAMAFNMNDTFYYACADVACIDVSELDDMEPIIEKCGLMTLVAYEAIRRGHDPQIPKYAQDPMFIEAKAAIQELMAKAEQYGELYELRMDLEAKRKALTAEESKRKTAHRTRLRDWFSFFR